MLMRTMVFARKTAGRLRTKRLLPVTALLLTGSMLLACADPAEEFAEQLEQQSDAYERLIDDLETESFRHLNRSLSTLLLLEADPQRSRADLVSLCLKLSDSFARNGDGVRGIQIDMLPGGGQADSEAPGKGLVAVWQADGEKLQWKVWQDAPKATVAIPKAARAKWRSQESIRGFQNDTDERHMRVRIFYDRSQLEARLKRIRDQYKVAQ